MFACQSKESNSVEKVTTIKELHAKIATAKAGDEIVLANGVWKDVEIVFKANGTKENPIVLRAETPGKVFIEGISNLKIGGNHLVIKDLHFRNGYTPTDVVILFKTDDDTPANHSKVTNCVIEEFTQLDRDATDHWVEFWGQHNELSHCYIAGKSNFGPTVRVQLKGNQHINNHHQIINNHFGPRPRKGGPHGETLQIGDSGTSMTPSYTNISNNYFERCNGEVEIISSKSNFNIFKNNVFFESEGSLVLRHGNYATIEGNVFIGNDNSEFIGGIRVVNTGHWIMNNYFYKLKGSEFRAPLAVMNGIPKSPLNRYNQVTDVVVAYNSFVECPTPWFFSVGSNVDKSDVLPKSEIRSARPIRTVFANNLIYNNQTATNPIHNYDKVDGILFEKNITNNENKSEVQPKGLTTVDFSINKLGDNLFVPTKNNTEVYNGFDFENINTDLFGESRAKNNAVGAITIPVKENMVLVNESNYGTDWFNPKKEKREPKTFTIHPKDLKSTIASAENGDIIVLESGEYTLDTTIDIDKKITITSADEHKKVLLNFTANNTAFLMKPKGDLRLQNISVNGNKTQNAFATLDKNMSKAYNLFLNNVEISNFKTALNVSKGSFADTISVKNTSVKNLENGFLLNQEIDAKGDYNAEFVFIENSSFDEVKGTVLDYFRGGYDESTIGGNLIFKNNTISHSGKESADKILIKNQGIVQAEISENTFINNPVKLIAILWGEKGQKPENNKIKNSGEFKIVQNLKQKLMY
ncbi:chondroitinase-B domain-containing protein [Wenyingzhuangia sp. IMCC45467]